LENLLATIIFFLRADAPARIAVDIAGPDRLAFDTVVARYRRWLGWRPTRVVKAPSLVARLLYPAGDIFRVVGVAAAGGHDGSAQITRGAEGDPAAWRQRASRHARSPPHSPVRGSRLKKWRQGRGVPCSELWRSRTTPFVSAEI
jgi:hypothetical protein